jgi:hypothetical protein
MQSTNADKSIQSKPAWLKPAIDGVFIWMFWGLYDFLGGHGHPFVADIFFFLFFVSLMVILALITNLVWKHPRIIGSAFVVVCGTFGFLVFAAVWSDVVRNIKSFLPAIASLATAFWWYRAARTMNFNSIEAKELRKKLDATAEITKDLKAWRTLTDGDKELLKNRLSQFSGRQFRVIQVGEVTDEESRKFAHAILATMKDCGWMATHELWCVPNVESMITLSWGVAFFMLPDGKTNEELLKSESLSAIGALFCTLQDIGVAAGMSRRSPSWQPAAPGIIEIHVGPKPPPHYVAPVAP